MPSSSIILIFKNLIQANPDLPFTMSLYRELMETHTTMGFSPFPTRQREFNRLKRLLSVAAQPPPPPPVPNPAPTPPPSQASFSASGIFGENVNRYPQILQTILRTPFSIDRSTNLVRHCYQPPCPENNFYAELYENNTMPLIAYDALEILVLGLRAEAFTRQRQHQGQKMQR